jgi:hypothetical protein
MRSKGADLQTPRRRDDRRAQRVDDALTVDTHGRAVQGSLRHVELELLRAHEGCVELPIWPKEAPGEELAPELALVEKPFFIYIIPVGVAIMRKKSPASIDPICQHFINCTSCVQFSSVSSRSPHGGLHVCGFNPGTKNKASGCSSAENGSSNRTSKHTTTGARTRQSPTCTL